MIDFNKEALEEAKKSLCKKRKVGAILVSTEGVIIGRGHNHHPDSKQCEDTNGYTYPEVVHAEIAAIDDFRSKMQPINIEVKPAKIYITHPPCMNCQKEIDKLGLEVIIVKDFMKFDAGKLRYSLIPPEAMKALAEVLTYGAKKYKPNNWKNVDSINRYVDALYRHLEAWRSGENFDKESGLSHLSHALTNISFLIYFENKNILNKSTK